MDLRALRYFTEVVRQQSFTRAADTLCVTQPTISKMVRQLEDELGQTLLERDRRQVRPTDAGRVVFDEGEALLAGARRLAARLADLSSLAQGELVLGLPPMVGAARFAPIVGAYRARYPKVALKLVEDGARAIEQRVKAGELEIGVAVLPVDTGVFDTLEVVCDPLCLISPAGSRWRGMTSVTLTMIAAERFILYPEDFTLSHRIAAAFAALGQTLDIAGRSAHWDFISELVSAGLGVALLPRSVARRLPPDAFEITTLAEDTLNWHLALIWRRDGYLTHAARAWLGTTRATLDQTKG